MSYTSLFLLLLYFYFLLFTFYRSISIFSFYYFSAKNFPICSPLSSYFFLITVHSNFCFCNFLGLLLVLLSFCNALSLFFFSSYFFTHSCLNKLSSFSSFCFYVTCQGLPLSLSKFYSFPLFRSIFEIYPSLYSTPVRSILSYSLDSLLEIVLSFPYFSYFISHTFCQFSFDIFLLISPFNLLNFSPFFYTPFYFSILFVFFKLLFLSSFAVSKLSLHFVILLSFFFII